MLHQSGDIADDAFETESTSPPAPVVQAAVSTIVADPPVEDDTDDEPEPATVAAADSEAGKVLAKKRGSLQERIDKAVFNQRAAERERDAAAQRATDLERQLSTRQAPPAAAEPATEKWEDWTAKNPGKSYEDFIAEVYVEPRLARERSAREHAESTRQVEQLQQAHVARLTAAQVKYTDWSEKAQAVSHIQVPNTLYAAVVGSNDSAEITYYLMSHPEEYAQIVTDMTTSATPVTAAPVVRRFLEKLVTAAPNGPAAAVPQQSRARPPIKPLGGGASVSEDDVDAIDDTDRWLAAANKRDGIPSPKRRR